MLRFRLLLHYLLTNQQVVSYIHPRDVIPDAANLVKVRHEVASALQYLLLSSRRLRGLQKLIKLGGHKFEVKGVLEEGLVLRLTVKVESQIVFVHVYLL